ncbi:MAG: Ig-like domain-containing protein [Tannerella sp.]|nr:Ig-like domain-containing protein [Tannerella sp.]
MRYVITLLISALVFASCETITEVPVEMSLSTSSMDFPDSGGEMSLIIISNTITWAVNSNASSWLTITPESGSKDGTVTLTASANTGTTERTATVTVKPTGTQAQTITVKQSPLQNISVSTTSLSFSASAGQQQFTIASNAAWTITSNQPWCTVQPASGNVNRVIAVSVSGNTSTSNRNATLTVTTGSKSQQVNIEQASNKQSNMYFEQSTYQLEQGFNMATKLIFVPENTGNKNVTYRSSNTAIAAVNAFGIITAIASGTEPGKGPGKATITATSDDGSTATCTVETFSPVDLVTVSVEIIYMVVAEGFSGTIVPTLHNNSSKPVTMVHFRLMEGVNSQDFKTSILLNNAILAPKSQFRLEQDVFLSNARNPRASFLIEYNGQGYIRDSAVTYP